MATHPAQVDYVNRLSFSALATHEVLALDAAAGRLAAAAIARDEGNGDPVGFMLAQPTLREEFNSAPQPATLVVVELQLASCYRLHFRVGRTLETLSIS